MAGSIVDYASLQTAVANWMARATNADLIANIPDFIGLFEDDLNFGYDDPTNPALNLPPLRTQDMQVTSFTLVLPNSTNTAILPADFLELTRLYYFQAGLTRKSKLKYVTPTNLDDAYGSFPTGPQAFFTLMGGTIILANNVNTTTTLIGGYFQKIPALSTSNTVNWLLTKRPSLYHAGGMFRGSLFVGDDNETAKWWRIVSGMVRAFNKQDTKARYGGDALYMRTDVGNP